MVAENNANEALGKVLLWDLAGTLLVHDQTTRRSGPLPGWDAALPDLSRDFRMVVATGEESGSARRLLTDYGMMPFFEEVFGDLLTPGGKPHGEILHRMGGRPELSLVIGDRLLGDLASDCDDLVTLLVNQDGEILNGPIMAAAVRHLEAAAATMPDAFRELVGRSEPDPESLGPCGGGMVTAAWRCDELSGARLWIFEPDWMDAQRSVVVI